MESDMITTVGVVGAGQMGRGICQVAAGVPCSTFGHEPGAG